LLFTVFLAGGSCNLAEGPEYGKGILTLLLPEAPVRGTAAQNQAALSRSVISDTDRALLSYKFTVTGPGERQTLKARGSGITLSLEAGRWTIEVAAYDPGNPSVLVGSGSLEITVAAGQTISVRIPMKLDPAYEAGLTAIYIHNEEDLRRVAAGDFDISGRVSFYLERDIVLTQPWTPIGSLDPFFSTNDNPFKAVFDGQGHSITISAFSAEALDGMSLGLFGGTEGAVIKNTTIVYDNLTAISSYSNPLLLQCLGGLAGFAYDTTVSGVHVRGAIQFTADSLSAGGLIGLAGSFLNAYTHVENCSFTGNLEVNGDRGAIAGGILGAHDDGNDGAIIETSYAAGKINAASQPGVAYAGGILGKGGGIIRNCYVAAVVGASAPSNEAYAGGIAGLTQEGTVSKCYARGSVAVTGTGDNYVGGIAGISYEDMNTTTIEYCAALNDNISGVSPRGLNWIAGSDSGTSTISPFATYTSNYRPSGGTLNGATNTGNGGNGSSHPLADFKAPGTVYGTGALNWDFSADGHWKWIDGYDYPVLAWQASPPLDPTTLP
jgi:hypothetical protein